MPRARESYRDTEPSYHPASTIHLGEDVNRFVYMLMMFVCQRPHPDAQITVMTTDEYLRSQEQHVA